MISPALMAIVIVCGIVCFVVGVVVGIVVSCAFEEAEEIEMCDTYDEIIKREG